MVASGVALDTHVQIDTTAPTVTTLTDVTSNGSDLDCRSDGDVHAGGGRGADGCRRRGATLSNGRPRPTTAAPASSFYTVAAGHDTSDLNVTGYSGSITDAAGNALVAGWP